MYLIWNFRRQGPPRALVARVMVKVSTHYYSRRKSSQLTVIFGALRLDLPASHCKSCDRGSGPWTEGSRALLNVLHAARVASARLYFSQRQWPLASGFQARIAWGCLLLSSSYHLSIVVTFICLALFIRNFIQNIVWKWFIFISLDRFNFFKNWWEFGLNLLPAYWLLPNMQHV